MTLDMRRMVKAELLVDIFHQGDFASIVAYDSQHDGAFLQQQAELLVECVQSHSIAFLVANDSRISGRIHADGVHLEGKVDELKELVERCHNSMIVGFGNLHDKHTSMLGGECEPDYLMFGKLGADKKPAPHPRNLSLGSWWAQVMEIPAIVQAGSDCATFSDVLATKAEFIAVEEVIFANDDPVRTVGKLSRMIDEYHNIGSGRVE